MLLTLAGRYLIAFGKTSKAVRRSSKTLSPGLARCMIVHLYYRAGHTTKEEADNSPSLNNSQRNQRDTAHGSRDDAQQNRLHGAQILRPCLAQLALQPVQGGEV